MYCTNNLMQYSPPSMAHLSFYILTGMLVSSMHRLFKNVDLSFRRILFLWRNSPYVQLLDVMYKLGASGWLVVPSCRLVANLVGLVAYFTGYTVVLGSAILLPLVPRLCARLKTCL